jgi:hypothetical protein
MLTPHTDEVRRVYGEYWGYEEFDGWRAIDMQEIAAVERERITQELWAFQEALEGIAFANWDRDKEETPDLRLVYVVADCINIVEGYGVVELGDYIKGENA